MKTDQASPPEELPGGLSEEDEDEHEDDPSNPVRYLREVGFQSHQVGRFAISKIGGFSISKFSVFLFTKLVGFHFHRSNLSPNWWAGHRMCFPGGRGLIRFLSAQRFDQQSEISIF